MIHPGEKKVKYIAKIILFWESCEYEAMKRKKKLSGLGSFGIKTETTLHEAGVHPFSTIIINRKEVKSSFGTKI